MQLHVTNLDLFWDVIKHRLMVPWGSILQLHLSHPRLITSLTVRFCASSPPRQHDRFEVPCLLFWHLENPFGSKNRNMCAEDELEGGLRGDFVLNSPMSIVSTFPLPHVRLEIRFHSHNAFFSIIVSATVAPAPLPFLKHTSAGFLRTKVENEEWRAEHRSTMWGLLWNWRADRSEV